MNSTVDHLYQSIARESLNVASAQTGRLLLYSEVESGVASADIFYEEEGSDMIRFRFASPLLQEKVYSLWLEWRKQPKNQEWRALCFVIDAGKFFIDLTYPDQLALDESLSDRRPRAVRKYFGDARIDYSNP